MREGPNIAQIGALLGDPARAHMLGALLSGKALTAGELAEIGGITPQTASDHLAKLHDGGLLKRVAQGRHRYYALASDEVAALLESLNMLAARQGHMRMRTGPKDPHLRAARLCYRHLAGAAGVHILDSLRARGLILLNDEAAHLTESGRYFLSELGLALPKTDIYANSGGLCKTCLDWSERRYHLGGRIGRDLWTLFSAKGWAHQAQDSRIVRFTSMGQRAFDTAFPKLETLS